MQVTEEQKQPEVKIYIISWPWEEVSEEGRLMGEYLHHRHDEFERMYGTTRYDEALSRADRDPSVSYIIVSVDGQFAGGQALVVKTPGSETQLPMEKGYELTLSGVFPHLDTETLTFGQGKGMVRLPEFRGMGVVSILYAGLHKCAQQQEVDVMIGSLTPANTRGTLAALDAAGIGYAVRDDIQVTGPEGLPRTYVAVAINPEVEILSERMKGERVGKPPVEAQIMEVGGQEKSRGDERSC